MKSKNIVVNAIVNAAATATYIALLVLLIFNTQHVFDKIDTEDSLLVPVIVLLLFVISAVVTGFLVLGKPLMWYLEGRKKQALSLLGFTIVFLVVIALVFITILL